MSERARPMTNGNGMRPRTMPVRPRGTLIAGLDIGSTKVCCFIARVEAGPRVLGIGHQVARGIRGGAIVDLDAAGHSIRSAVHAAEEMAGETVDRVVVNLSGGYAASRIVKAEIDLARREIGDAELRPGLARGYRMRQSDDRHVIHSIPGGVSIDQSRGIRDPRGLGGERR